MGHQAGFHAPQGGAQFLGYRTTRHGTTEIVYDDGVARRMIWRVDPSGLDEADLSEALRMAVGRLRILPALYEELKKRAIAVECVAG